MVLRLFSILRLNSETGQSEKYKHNYAGHLPQHHAAEWRPEMRRCDLKKAAGVGMTYLLAGEERSPSG
jgi:hypothetical protein